MNINCYKFYQFSNVKPRIFLMNTVAWMSYCDSVWCNIIYIWYWLNTYQERSQDKPNFFQLIYDYVSMNMYRISVMRMQLNCSLLTRQSFSYAWINLLIEVEWYIRASVNYTTTGSDNALSSDQYQAMIWNNEGLLLIGPSAWNFSEIFIIYQQFSSRKWIWKGHQQNGGHFVSVSKCWWNSTGSLATYVTRPLVTSIHPIEYTHGFVVIIVLLLGTLLLIWFKFNHSMDNQSYPL